VRSLRILLVRHAIAGSMFAAVVAGCSKDVTSPIVNNPGPTRTVNVAFCTGVEPRWVAFQDGDGGWLQAQPVVSGQQTIFSHTFAFDHAAIATAREFGSGLTTLDIQYGTPEELTIVADTNPAHCGPAVSKTLLGTVAGLDTNEVASISASSFSRAFVVPDAQHSFVLSGLAEGPQDILAARNTRVNNAEVLTKLILRRTPQLADSATLPVLDFNSAEAFAPAVASVTVFGQGPEGVITHTTLLTANSQSVISFRATNATAATHGYDAVPESKLAAGDLQVLTAAVAPSASMSEATRTASLYFRTPGNQMLAMGAPLIPPTVTTIATTPTLRLRAVFVAQPDYDRSTLVTYQQSDHTLVTVGMTATYAGLTGRGYELSIPDLSTVSGFQSVWALHANTDLIWNASRTGGTLGLGLNAVPTNGATERNAVSLFTLMTP
jgi:hypothetical protein